MMLSPHDIMDHVDPTWLSHVLTGIADAAAPTMDAVAPVVEEAKKEVGWFDQYIGLVMNCIKTLHGT
jgi:hypothetical protein